MTQYRGSCHCGKVSFQVELDIESVMACNCSICSRRGHLLAFTTADHFELLSGKDSLSDYQFHKKHIHHNFCKTCGVGAFSHGPGPDGKEHYAINTRCLEGLDLTNIEVKNFDGASV